MRVLLKIDRMNKQFFLCLFLLIATNLAAQDRVIENPAYEFNNSGITNISKIELGENETRVYVHTTFLPGWWTKFGSKDYLEDCATGKKWYVTDIRNGEFDREIFMPASGDSTFILVFPKLDKSVEKINYSEDTEEDHTTIYGISLDPTAKRPDNSVPPEVTKWINGELAKAKRKTLMDFDAGEFFSHDTARLIGYIKGYDRRAGFESGMIYLANEITMEEQPRVVRIFPDGRFDCLLPVCYPNSLKVAFQNRHFDFYIQPGTTLSMILDWEEFRTADRLRNIRYKFSDIQYDGATASVNKELTAFYSKLEELPYQQINEKKEDEKPDEYKTRLKRLMSKYTDACRQTANDKNMSKLAKSIIKNDCELRYAGFLLNYVSIKQGDLPVEFYGFLKDVPLNDRQILSSTNFGTFIVFLEFSRVLSEKKLQTPEKTLYQHLYGGPGLPYMPEDVKLHKDMDSLFARLKVSKNADEQKTIVEQLNEANRIFTERHKKQIDEYTEKYVKPFSWSPEVELKRWHFMDSVYTNVLQLKPGIVLDMIKAKKSKMLFEHTLMNSEKKLPEVLASIQNSLHDNFLKQEVERFYNKRFSPNRPTAYELPDTEDAAVFKKIIQPFKGQYILVIFWSAKCDMCFGEISQNKSTRESYRDSKDVAIVFITGEDESPTDKYEKLVKEQEMTNPFRIGKINYQSFRQLFAFPGIFHYIIVDRDGRIVNRTVNAGNYDSILKESLEKEKQQ
jgi:hypothetical protein